MIKDSMDKIKNKIKKGKNIGEKTRDQLLSLIKELAYEINQLSNEKKEHAESIADFTKISTHEATREVKNPDLIKISLDGLSHSVKEFEVSHPKLTSVVNNICQILANMGI